MKAFYTDRTVSTWDELLRLTANYGDDWIYRGQSNDWPLASSLERACRRAVVPLKEAPKVEEQLLREFRRRFHLYVPTPPPKEDTPEWLAIMQHHGAPTRLLDWTYSVFVAAYFAFEKAEKTQEENITGDSVLWAIRVPPLVQRLRNNAASLCEMAGLRTQT